jgi:tyrosyl-tRNA synthetase
MFSKEEIEALELQHNEAPHLRALQKALAKDLTIRVHSEEDYHAAIEASEILFGKGTTDTLKRMSEDTLLSVFEGVPQCEVSKTDIENGINIVDFVSDKTGIFPSKGEARRMLKDNGVSVNKEKVSEATMITSDMLLNQKYLIVQKGKKNYYLVIFQ